MKRLLPALALIALTPFVHARLEENLPPTAYGVVKVESVATARKNLDANPIGLALKADKFKEFLKPLTDKALEEAAAGKNTDLEKNRDEIAAAFTGEAVFALVKTPDTAPGHLPYDYIVVADTTLDQDGVAALLKKLGLHQPVTPAKKFTPTPQKQDEDEDEPEKPALEVTAADEDYHGVTLHTLNIREDGKPVTLSGWAVVNKTLVFATAPNVLRDLVDARKDGRKDNYTGSAVYKANAAALAGNDVWALVDMPLVAGALHDLVAEKTAGEAAAPGLDLLKAYDTLALDAFSHVRIAASFKPEDTHLDSAIGWTEKRGLVKVLVEPFAKDGGADLSKLPDNVLVASSLRYDFGLMLKEFETLVRQAVPMAGPMIDMRLGAMKAEGVDLRDGLLDNFGDSLRMVSDLRPAEAAAPGMPPMAMDVVYVFSLKDETKLESLIETALGKVASEQTGDGAKSFFDERELLGVKVRTLKEGAPGTHLRYAVSKGLLFLSLGDGKTFDNTLSSFLQPGKSLADNPDVKAALAKLPPDPAGVSYYDLGHYAEFYGKFFPAMLESNPLLGRSLPKLDPEKAPRASDFPFVGVGVNKLGDNELTGRTIFFRKSDENR